MSLISRIGGKVTPLNGGARTIGQIMDDNNGVGPGYDLLRVALAFAVVFRHSFPISLGDSEAASSGFLWTATMGIVPIFFILSGFLVTGSALRLPLGKFVASRALRIIPALAVDTLVTILVIGVLFTTVPLADYFTSPVTLRYLLNIVGEIHYYLPGVFENNALPRVVNGSLWTIPAELGCYVFMSALIFFRWIADWRKILVLTILSFGLILAASFFPNNMPGFVRAVATHQGAVLVPDFLIGALLFHKRHSIPYWPPLFWICIGLILGSGFLLPDTTFSVMPAATVLAVPIYGYVCVFIGATKMPKLPFFSRGDYSYGIYLYGFPIQQAVAAATGVVNPFALFLMAVPPITAMAALSWHLVEKPTLKLRKGFSMAAQREAKREAEAKRALAAEAAEAAAGQAQAKAPVPGE